MTQPCIIHNEATSGCYFEERCYITEWWNSPHDEEASVACVRVEPGITTRLHCLKGVTERYVILEGKGCVEVGELAPEAVGPGDVVVIPPWNPATNYQYWKLRPYLPSNMHPTIHPRCL
jgi:quercetin dioxygenase-like cupin family protein